MAYCTLLTNDEYLPGALVLCKSIKRTQSLYPIILLVTNQVSEKACQVCRKYYDDVITVPMLKSNDFGNLELLGRPELGVTFSKIHVFNPDIMPYQRICFLDSDVLILQSIDSIFGYLDEPDTVFGACPDVGWPDCFNSGVFVTKPNRELYNNILKHSLETGSFDGGDQGLLNSFFSNWGNSQSTDKTTCRLPFVFNVTPTAYYSYLPALRQFKSDIKAVHFIGNLKPWKWSRYSNGNVIKIGECTQDMVDLVQTWWNIFDENMLHLSMKDFFLHRDWSLYQPPVKVLDKPVSQPTSLVNEKKFDSLTENLGKYRVEWKEHEVGYVERRNSKSSLRSRSRSPEKTMRGISPIRSSSPIKRSKSPIKSIPEELPVPISELQPVYPTTNYMMSRMIPMDETPETLEEFNISWNISELAGMSLLNPQSRFNSKSSSPTYRDIDEIE